MASETRHLHGIAKYLDIGTLMGTDGNKMFKSFSPKIRYLSIPNCGAKRSQTLLYGKQLRNMGKSSRHLECPALGGEFYLVNSNNKCNGVVVFGFFREDLNWCCKAYTFSGAVI